MFRMHIYSLVLSSLIFSPRILAKNISDGDVFKVDTRTTRLVHFEDLGTKDYRSFQIVKVYHQEEEPQLLSTSNDTVRVSALVEGNTCGMDAELRYFRNISAWVLVYPSSSRPCIQLGIPAKIELQISSYSKSSLSRRALLWVTDLKGYEADYPLLEIEALSLED